MTRAFEAHSCLHHSHADRYKPPFFGAYHALAVDDGGGRACLATVMLPALHIKHMMDAIERAVVAPQVEIIMHRATWRQVFRDRPPLASRARSEEHTSELQSL